MVDLTFRTLGPWGAGKGANLDAPEVDNNFWSLAEAIFALQNDPAVPNGIASIAVSGTQMTITLHDGTVLGPYTLPVLTFRWRGEWQPSTIYAVLDVFTVFDTGIFMVQIAHTSDLTFDQEALIADGTILQLFGSTDAKLSGLSDVQITSLADQDFLTWIEADQKWENVALGTMAYQLATGVAITGGTITGMPAPIDPADVATKAYVDALPAGMTSASGSMMANITLSTAPAIPNTLSNYLDFVLSTTTRGTMLFRGGSGWIALAPGTSGYFLQTAGPGADPAWHVGGSGVTSVAAGAGISTGGAPITGTGSVALATISSGYVLSNISGSVAAPTPNTLTALLDALVGNVRGSVAYRGGTVWTALPPDSSGKYLKTQGPGVDPMWDSPTGAGTVTSVGTGTGLTGGPITSAGSISLAPIADAAFLGNISGASAAPLPVTLTQFLDHIFASSAQGSVIYRGGSAYAALGPGTSGQVLTTGGSSANPSWASGAGGAAIADHYLLANLSGSTAVATGHSLSDILDNTISSSRGTLLMRGGSGWLALAPGTAGQVLTTGGSSADPAWAAGGGISIGDTPPASPSVGQAWWDSLGGQLYIRYNDGTSTQWVPASTPIGISTVVAGTGLSGGGSTSSVTVALATPVSVANGGTNATTAAAALANLGGAPLASPVLTGNPQSVTPPAGDADTSIATTAFVAPAFNGTGRNLVHNSMFNIAQRGAGPWTVATNFTTDRWQINFSGSLSASQIALSDADRAAIGDEAATAGMQFVFTGDPAAGGFMLCQQAIEKLRRLSGKTVTVSFWARCTAGALKLGVEPYEVFGTGGSPSAAVTGTGVAVTLSTSWARYTATLAPASTAGKTFGTNNDDTLTLVLWLSSGTTFAARAGSIGVQSGTIQLWGVQLEIGTQATPLEKPDPRYDLANCQRFFQTGYWLLQTYSGSAAFTCQVMASLPVQMRAYPTMTIAGTPTYTNCSGATIASWDTTHFVVSAVATAVGSLLAWSTYTASADL